MQEKINIILNEPSFTIAPEDIHRDPNDRSVEHECITDMTDCLISK